MPTSFGFQMPEQEKTDPGFVGTWRFYDRSSDDASLVVRHEELPRLKQQGRDYAADFTLVIGDDGWFKLTDFSGFERNNLSDNGDGSVAMNVGGEASTATIADGFLVLRAPDSVTRYEKTSDVGDPMAKDAEDIPAVVVRKLEGDYFPDRYEVRTDSGDTMECEYIGFEDLAPGTGVVLSKWGRGWMIELPFSWGSADDKPEEHLYDTKDGVTLDDPDVRLAGGRIWSFAYTLANPTEKDAEFDPSLFVLRRSDGTEIPTMARAVSKDRVSAGTRYFRVSINIGKADAVKLGEEVSLWYDGVFLATVTAREF